MRVDIITVGDLVRELMKYPSYVKVFINKGESIEELQYNTKITYLDASDDYKPNTMEGLLIK